MVTNNRCHCGILTALAVALAWACAAHAEEAPASATTTPTEVPAPAPAPAATAIPAAAPAPSPPPASAAKKAELKGTMKFVSDAPLEKVVGTASGRAELSVDFSDLAAMTGVIKVLVESMQTGNDRRDSHLRGADWLDAAAHPEILFVLKSVKPSGPPVIKGPVSSVSLDVTGDFTLHGVTKPLTVKAELKWKGDKLKITTAFQIGLADFAVEGAKGVVGRKVGKTIEIQARLVGKVQ